MPTVVKSEKYAGANLGAASDFGITMPFNLSTYSASGIWSVRRVRHAYVGPCAYVYQGSTAAYGYLHFDSDGEVSGSSLVQVTVAGSSGYTVGQQVTLTAFASTADVYVTKWYDQSGNHRDFACPASPTTRSPRLYISGVLQTLNSRATLAFDGSDDNFALTWAASQPLSLIWTGLTSNNTTTGTAVSSTVAGTGPSIFTNYTSGNERFLLAGTGGGGGTTVGDATADIAAQRVYAALFNGASSSFYANRGLIATGNAGNGAVTAMYLGVNANLSTFYNTKVSELLAYGDASAYFDAISVNCMAFYGIL